MSKLYVVFGITIWVSKNWSQSCKMSRSEDNVDYKEIFLSLLQIPYVSWLICTSEQHWILRSLLIVSELGFVFFYGLICSVNVCNSGLEHVKASKQKDF